MNIDELALKVGAEIWPDTVRNTEECARFARIIIAEYEKAAGSEPVVVVSPKPHHKTWSEIDKLLRVGTKLYMRPDQRVAELEAEIKRLQEVVMQTVAADS